MLYVFSDHFMTLPSCVLGISLVLQATKLIISSFSYNTDATVCWEQLCERMCHGRLLFSSYSRPQMAILHPKILHNLPVIVMKFQALGSLICWRLKCLLRNQGFLPFSRLWPLLQWPKKCNDNFFVLFLWEGASSCDYHCTSNKFSMLLVEGFLNVLPLNLLVYRGVRGGINPLF